MQTEKTKNISGAILAGGENIRFGGIIKSNLIIGDSTIISHIVNTISDIFSEIIIVTNTPDEFQSFNLLKIVPDQFLNVGPLGGIHSAIKASSKESVFVFAGDMPFIDKEIIMNEIKYFSSRTADVVVPRVDGYDEPLHAIYRNSIFDSLDQYLSDNNKYATRDFLVRMNVNYMHLHSSEKTKRAFTNINTPGEAGRAK